MRGGSIPKTPHQILGRRAGRGRHRLPSVPKIMKPETRHAHLPPCTVERLAYSITPHWAAVAPDKHPIRPGLSTASEN